MITEESFLDFKCPYCGQAVAFPQMNAGSVQACPDCTESLIVPEDASPVGRPIPLPAKTQRLVLRRLNSADWKDLLEFMSDEEMFRFVEAGPNDEEGILRWLERDAVVKLTTPGETIYIGIELQEGSKLVGFVSLNFTDAERQQVMVQVFVNRAWQRKGLAREALEGVLTFCFDQIHLHRVTAHCPGANTAACRLFERAGFRREGEFIQDRLLHGQWANTVWFARLAQEFQGKPAGQ
jgi:RimJ/RimL family protein N-acetyltransferase